MNNKMKLNDWRIAMLAVILFSLTLSWMTEDQIIDEQLSAEVLQEITVEQAELNELAKRGEYMTTFKMVSK